MSDARACLRDRPAARRRATRTRSRSAARRGWAGRRSPAGSCSTWSTGWRRSWPPPACARATASSSGLPNHRWTPVYLFALWKLGAIVVPFDREMNPEAAAAIIESVDAPPRHRRLRERPAWARDGAIVEWWEPGTRDEGEAGEAGRPSGETCRSGRGEELAAIFFTSGTTGNPKGCMITHANLCSAGRGAGRASSRWTRTAAGQHPAALAPVRADRAGCSTRSPRGAAIHYVPSRRGPDILRVLNEQRITHMIAVPQLLTLMGKALDDQLRKQLPGPAYRALIAAGRPAAAAGPAPCCSRPSTRSSAATCGCSAPAARRCRRRRSASGSGSACASRRATAPASARR